MLYRDFSLDAVLGRLLRNDLPWEHAWTADFAAFNERFTLHDSIWVGVFLPLSEGNEAIIVVEWDAHWLPEPLHTECSPGPRGFGLPLLIMRISCLHGLDLSGYDQPLGGRAISYAESDVQEGLNVLEIRDIVDGTVGLEFAGRIDFLALHRLDGHVLDLAQVEPQPEPVAPAKPWWKFW